MMEPEFKTDVLAEHAAFSGAIHGLDQYLKSVLGVKQGRKNGQVIPDPEKSKEPFSAATIKHFLEQMCDPLFTHVRLIDLRLTKADLLSYSWSTKSDG
jgi:hypothetical protein